MDASAIALDQSIRSWAFIPMAAVVIGITVFRRLVSQLLQEPPKAKKVTNDTKFYTGVARARMLKRNFNVLSEKAYKVHKGLFLKKDKDEKSVGLLWRQAIEKTEEQKMAEMKQAQEEMTNMNQMKGQFVFIFLQGGLAWWASTLFSGFIVGKTPFPLTYQFRPMMLRGIEVPALDVTYISAFSWYFMILIGCGGMISLFNSLREVKLEEESAMQAMMGIAPGGADPAQNPMAMLTGGVGGPDLNKMNNDMKDELELCQYVGFTKNIEAELVKKWKYS